MSGAQQYIHIQKLENPGEVDFQPQEPYSHTFASIDKSLLCFRSSIASEEMKIRHGFISESL